MQKPIFFKYLSATTFIVAACLTVFDLFLAYSFFGWGDLEGFVFGLTVPLNIVLFVLAISLGKDSSKTFRNAELGRTLGVVSIIVILTALGIFSMYTGMHATLRDWMYSVHFNQNQYLDTGPQTKSVNDSWSLQPNGL